MSAHLIQQADGTIVTAAGVAQQVGIAAAAAGVSARQAVATGQQMADHGIAAIENTAVQVGQSAQQYAASLGGFLTSLSNNWTGANAAAAGGADVSAAASHR